MVFTQTNADHFIETLEIVLNEPRLKLLGAKHEGGLG